MELVVRLAYFDTVLRSARFCLLDILALSIRKHVEHVGLFVVEIL